MTKAIDINHAEIQESVHETIVWCTHRQLTCDPVDKEDVSHRFARMDEGSDLMHQAYKESQTTFNRLLRRDYLKSSKYKRGKQLVAEAGKSSSTLFAHRLRTPELRASINYTVAPDDESAKRIVHSLVRARSALVAKLEFRQGKPHPEQGRLLCYWPDENLACGAAEVQSLGFFDVDNTPPWDLWVAFSDGMLLSWVPHELFDLAQRGIEVNPEACIAWFQ